MQPKSPSILECPVGRAVETVGEWWSILILRDAFQGSTKFEEVSQSLGIAPNILSRRLAHLTESGCSSAAAIMNGRRVTNMC